jgi:hypothetical protein
MAQTVVSTNQRIDFLVKIAGGVLLLGVGWLGWISVALFNMHGDISAIKQAEKINGTENCQSPRKATLDRPAQKRSGSNVDLDLQFAKRGRSQAERRAFTITEFSATEALLAPSDPRHR